MKKIRNSVKLFDFTSFEFPEILFSKLGSDGRIPFWLKCISLSFFLYCTGVVATYFSNTLLPCSETNFKTPYLLDYSFLTVCAVLGFTLTFLFSTLRKLDDAIVEVSKRIGVLSNPLDEKKFMEYVSYIKQWMPAGQRIFERPWFWYYLDTAGGAVFGALFGIYWSTHSTYVWWGRAQYPLAAVYFVCFCAIVAYNGGAIIFAIMGSIKAVRRYCRDFVKSDRILALNPDKVGGLRPLGQFSLGLDISFSLSSFIIFSYLVQGVSITDPIVVITLMLYTIILVVVFFIPLSAAHDKMLEAKEKAYDQINNMFKEISSRLMTNKKSLDTKYVKALKDVVYLHERVAKMAVWPLNISLMLKFALTSSFPIIGSIIVAYISKLFGL